MFSLAPFSTTPVNALVESLLYLRASLDSSSEIDTNSKIIAKIQSILSNDNNLTGISTVKNFNSTVLSGSSDSEISGKILILLNSEFNNNVSLTSQYLTRTLGFSDLASEQTFNVDSFIRVLDQASIDVNFEIYGLIGARYFNQADLGVYAIVTSNLSQVNRDIVYYILTVNRSNSHIFNILRVK